MKAIVSLKNNKECQIDNINKIIQTEKQFSTKEEISSFDDFVFRNGYFYTFIGDSTFMLEGTDIFSINFIK